MKPPVAAPISKKLIHNPGVGQPMSHPPCDTHVNLKNNLKLTGANHWPSAANAKAIASATRRIMCQTEAMQQPR